MTKRSYLAKSFGHQFHIHYRILTRLGRLMGIVVPHNPTNLFKKRSIDDQEIGYFQIRAAFLDAAHGPDPRRVGVEAGKLLLWGNIVP